MGGGSKVKMEVGRGILVLSSEFSMESLKVHGLGIRPTQIEILVPLCDSGQKAAFLSHSL